MRQVRGSPPRGPQGSRLPWGGVSGLPPLTGLSPAQRGVAGLGRVPGSRGQTLVAVSPGRGA